MKLSKKQTGLYLMIAIIIILITAGLLINYNYKKSDYLKNEIQNNTAVKNINEQKKISNEISKNTQNENTFKSNDDIKKVYGRIETVYLWNGKTYTGAVIVNNSIYNMVTVDGIKTIPIKDVKLREMVK